jgi:hypothetical protein
MSAIRLYDLSLAQIDNVPTGRLETVGDGSADIAQTDHRDGTTHDWTVRQLVAGAITPAQADRLLF